MRAHNSSNGPVATWLSFHLHQASAQMEQLHDSLCQGREWQEYMAQGLQGEEGCPLCHCTKGFGNLWENNGTCAPELHKPSAVAVPKTGRLVSAGSTRRHACSLPYQRTLGEVLWVIKKHEKRTW